MGRFVLLSFLAFGSQLNYTTVIWGQTPAISADRVVEEWVKRSSSWQYFDADICRWSYSDIRLEFARGRFYVEQHRIGAYEIHPVAFGSGQTYSENGRSYRLVTGDEESIVWTDEAVLLFGNRYRNVRSVSRVEMADLVEKLRQNESAPSIYSNPFFRGLGLSIMCFASPGEMMPLVAPREQDKLQQRYHLTAAQDSRGISIIARPKDELDAARIDEITVVLDPETYTPRILRISIPDGRTVDYAFTKVLVNACPMDRSTLMSPELRGYNALRIPDTHDADIYSMIAASCELLSFGFRTVIPSK
jgi:hypothetical protein